MGHTRREKIKEKMDAIDNALRRCEEHFVDILALMDGVNERPVQIVAMTATLTKELREHVRKIREEFGW